MTRFPNFGRSFATAPRADADPAPPTLSSFDGWRGGKLWRAAGRNRARQVAGDDAGTAGERPAAAADRRRSALGRIGK